MVTRSIVGRILILAVLIVSLGVMAQAALIITHSPLKKESAAIAKPADGTGTSASQQADATPIRVVYPGPLSDGSAPPRKITDAATASPLASTAVASFPPAAAANPDAASPASPAAQSAPAAAASLEPVPASTEPTAAAPVDVASVDPAVNGPAAPAPTAGEGKSLNINSASAEALNHLQGGGRIGQSIVQHRPYKSVEELVKKRVLRRAVYDQIKGQIAAE